MGAYKVEAYPRGWGRLEGTSPKVSLPQKKSLKQGIWSPHFWGISPKLFGALRGIHPYLSTPILPRGQILGGYFKITLKNQNNLLSWVHRGRSDRAANANAISDAPWNLLANSRHQISIKKLRIQRCEGTRQRMRMVLWMKLREFRPRCGNSLRMEVCDKIR